MPASESRHHPLKVRKTQRPTASEQAQCSGERQHQRIDGQWPLQLATANGAADYRVGPVGQETASAVSDEREEERGRTARNVCSSTVGTCDPFIQRPAQPAYATTVSAETQ